MYNIPRFYCVRKWCILALMKIFWIIVNIPTGFAVVLVINVSNTSNESFNNIIVVVPQKNPTNDIISLKELSSVDVERAIRPVITIKSHSIVKQGNGSTYNPYILEFEV